MGRNVLFWPRAAFHWNIECCLRLGKWYLCARVLESEVHCKEDCVVIFRVYVLHWNKWFACVHVCLSLCVCECLRQVFSPWTTDNPLEHSGGLSSVEWVLALLAISYRCTFICHFRVISCSWNCQLMKILTRRKTCDKRSSCSVREKWPELIAFLFLRIYQRWPINQGLKGLDLFS